MRATLKIKPPRQTSCLGDSDPGCLDNPGSESRRTDGKEFSPKTIQPVSGPVNSEGLGELSGAGAQLRVSVRFPPPAHGPGSACGLEGADEDKAVLVAALHEEVQKPVNPVVEVNIGGSRRMYLDKMPGGRTAERVAGLVIPHRIRLRFDDDPSASAPEKLAADEHPRAVEGIAHKKTTVHRHGAVRWNSRRGAAFHPALKGTGSQRASRFSAGVAAGISQPALTMKGFPDRS